MLKLYSQEDSKSNHSPSSLIRRSKFNVNSPSGISNTKSFKKLTFKPSNLNVSFEKDVQNV